MAWNRKYRFRYGTINGVDINIYIDVQNYSGSVIERALGRSPVLKRTENGPICGTSLTLYAECKVDGEFAELYTSNPNEYRVEVFRGSNQIWTGFITPELYSEPSIAPPYDVEIVATDGLGELKLHNFEPQGEVTLRAMLFYLLSASGAGRSIYTVSTLRTTAQNVNSFINNAKINLDFLSGETRYEVLTQLLNTLHASITMHNGDWLIVRETDLVIGSGEAIGAAYTANRGATTVGASISGAVLPVGQMGQVDTWPVGHLSTRVEPAKRSVTIEAPWHGVNLLKNPDMATNSLWEGTTSYWEAGKYMLPAGGLYGIYQDVPLNHFQNVPLDISVRCSRRAALIDDMNFVAITLMFTDSNSIVYYYESKGGKWSSTRDGYDEYNLTNYTLDRNVADEYTLSVPGLPLTEDLSGTLRVIIRGRNASIFGASVLTRVNAGYRDTIVINNGARGTGDTTEILGGRMLSSTDPVSPNALEGIWLDASGVPIGSSFLNRHYTAGKDYLSLTALDYAMSLALPRLILTGVVNIPAEWAFLPFVVKYRGSYYQIRTFEYNIFDEELNINAISLPAATLTVESEVVTSMGYAKAVASSSSSGGGGTPTPTPTTVNGGTVFYGHITSTKATTAKVATVTGMTAADLKPGATVVLFCDYSNSATGATLNVNSTGAKPMRDMAALDGSGFTYDWSQYETLTFVYDGTSWNLVNKFKAYGSYRGNVKIIGSLALLLAASTYSDDQTISASTAKEIYDLIQGGGGGVSSVGLTMPTGFSVTGSPVTGSGTLRVALANGYKMLKTTEWNEAYVMRAPVLEIHRGYRRGEQTSVTPYLIAKHPAIGAINRAEFVLMVRTARKGRRRDTKQSFYRKAWGMAMGQDGEGALTFGSTVTLTALREFILHNYCSGYLTNVSAMTYAQFKQLTVQVGFGHPTGNLDAYAKKIKHTRVFGIAVRYTNPAFAELASGPLSDHTAMIKSGGTVIPRWIYSEVAPILVRCERGALDGTGTNDGGVIGFRLLP